MKIRWFVNAICNKISLVLSKVDKTIGIQDWGKGYTVVIGSRTIFSPRLQYNLTKRIKYSFGFGSGWNKSLEIYAMILNGTSEVAVRSFILCYVISLLRYSIDVSLSNYETAQKIFRSLTIQIFLFIKTSI